MFAVFNRSYYRFWQKSVVVKTLFTAYDTLPEVKYKLCTRESISKNAGSVLGGY